MRAAVTPRSDSIEELVQTIVAGVDRTERTYGDSGPSVPVQRGVDAEKASRALADRARKAERERDELRVLIGPVNMVAVDSMLDRVRAAEARVEVGRDLRRAAYERIKELEAEAKAMREDMAIAIEDVLLLGSPEGDSPKNIAANLRASLAASESSDG